MRKKSTDIYIDSNTPDTKASSTYSTAGTNSELDSSLIPVIRSDISHIKEILELRISQLDTNIKDILDSLSGRETKFWIINGIVIAAIVTIFLWALPEIYRHDYKTRYDETNNSIHKVEERLVTLENVSTSPIIP